MNALESVRNGVDDMEERISKLTDRNLDMIHVEEEREENSMGADSFRKGNIRVTSIPEKKEKEKGEEFKEIIADNFPNLGNNWIYSSLKLREHLIATMQKDPL